MNASRRQFADVLDLCRNSAHDAFDDCDATMLSLAIMLRAYVRLIDNVTVPHRSEVPAIAYEVLAGFEEHVNTMQESVGMHAEQWLRQLQTSYAALRARHERITIALFGRTRTGKSTLMEALTEGSGAAIGVGLQHTTRETTVYPWPSHDPVLDVVDTPGIEGFQGDELAQIAENFVDQADHIFFLISDDAVSPDELQRFELLRTREKPVTVILNVKSQDLDLLVTAPEFVFDERELREHREHICRYLESHLGVVEPEIIHIHAQAAWEASRMPLGAERERLRAASHIGEVEQRILRFIREDAIAARIRSPRSMLLDYIKSMKESFRPLAGQFRADCGELQQNQNQVRKAIAKVRLEAGVYLRELDRVFHLAAIELPGLVDGLIATGSTGANVQVAWEKHLTEHGVEGVTAAFKQQVVDCFADSLQEEQRAYRAEIELSRSAPDVAGAFERVAQMQGAESRGRYVRAGIKTAASAAAFGLLEWALGNFWNPSGLVAVGAAVVMGGISVAAGWGAGQALEGLRSASRREIQAERNAIVERLMTVLDGAHQQVNAGCRTWLSTLLETQSEEMLGVLQRLEAVSQNLWRAASGAMDQFDELQLHLESDLAKQVCRMYVPEVCEGLIAVTRAVREPGLAAKVVVSGSLGLEGSAVPLCVGRAGSRARQVAHALGVRDVSFIDELLPLHDQVAQALRPAHIDSAMVRFSDTTQGQVIVTAPPDEASRSIGYGGVNVRLAAEALRLVDIQIVT